MINRYVVRNSSPLVGTVQEFWQVIRTNPDGFRETIIPKGVIEVIFNISETDNFLAQMGHSMFRVPRCFVNGFHTQPIVLDLDKQQTFFGVVFYPTQIKNIFGIPASEFANCCTDLTLENPFLLSLWHQLAEHSGFNERVKCFSDWLLPKISTLSKRDEAFNTFLTSPLPDRAAAPRLAEYFCYSPRQLSRKLNELTGMNTERTLLYKRYLQTINLIHLSSRPLSEIGHTCDFADQAHFIKTFKSFAGITPGQYRSKKSFLPAHLFEVVR